MADQIDTVETIADLQNLDVTGRNYVHVGGYNQTNDGGGGLFKWYPGDTTTADNGIVFDSSAASGRWKRMLHTNEVWVEWWGAVGDGETDDSAAIQAGIDYLLSTDLAPQEHPDGYQRGGTLFFSGRKNYYLLSPLKLFGGIPMGISLKGVSPANTVGGGPVLTFDYNDKPGIIIQTGRVNHIENLTLVGLNDFAGNFSEDSDYAIDDNYYNETAAVRQNRYSPYAAISIDSFENSISSGDQYPGLSSLYSIGGGSGSKQTHIVGCTILNWYVGIMIDSSAGNAQGDGCFIHHNQIASCTYGISIGQTQSRGIDLRDNEIGPCKIAFDLATFGQRNGTPPHIQGGLVSGIKYLMLGGQGVGNLQVDGVYGEVVISLGAIGTVSHPNGTPTVFTGCQFSFVETTKQAEAHLIFGSDVKFIGCMLSSLGAGCLYFQSLSSSIDDSPSIEFDNCSLGTQNALCGESEIYVNAINHVRWRGSAYFDNYWNAHLATGSRHPLTEQRRISSLARISGKTVTPGELIITPSDIYVTDFAQNVINIGSSHDISYDGNGGATLTLPDPALFKVGDVVRGAESNGPFNITVQGATVYNVYAPKVGVISEIDGTTATLIEVPAFLDDGSITLTDLEVVSMKRIHLPTTGDVLEQYDFIDNVVVSGGTLGSSWFLYNRIYGEGIPDGTYITDIDTNSNRIYISSTTSVNVSGASLFDARYSTIDTTPVV